MPRKSESETPRTKSSRYMTFREVADELGFKSVGPIYDLARNGAIDVAPIGPTGRGLRATRASFEQYCLRIEEEGRRRFRVA